MKNLCVIFTFVFILSCEDKDEKDTTPPSVTITSPTSGSTINEIVNITCMSTDDKGVQKVELWVDGQSTGMTDETEPYSFKLNTTNYKDGSHTLIVRSYDTSENQSDSSPVTVVVDNTVSVPNSISVTSATFSNGGFTINWSKSTDDDFKSYSIEHSVESQMNDYEEIFFTKDVNITTTRMDDASPLSYHYFRVTVTDTFDYETKGSIYSTSLDPIPDSVDVKSVTYDLNEMNVEWIKSVENDFKKYTLLFSKTENGSKDTLGSYLDINQTSYSTSSFNPTHENWFWVIVTDTLGQSKTGNGKTNTIELPPAKVAIKEVAYDTTKMTINWNESNDNDFKKYNLYYSVSKSGQKKLISTINNKKTTFYDTLNFDPTIENWFFVEVVDLWNLKTMGLGKTNTIDSNPSKAEIDSIKYDHINNTFTINWSKNNDNDFEYYEIFEANAEDMSGSVSLSKIYNQNKTDLSTTVDPALYKYYRIDTYDMWGLKTESNIKFASSFITFKKTFPMGNIGYDIIEIEDGYIVAGSAYEDTLSKDYLDLYFLRTNALGEKVSEKKLGYSNTKDFAKKIIKDNKGQYFLYGESYYNNAMYQLKNDIYYAKVDKDGNLIKERFSGSKGDEYSGDILQDANGDIVTINSTNSSGFPFGNGSSSDLFLNKMDEYFNPQPIDGSYAELIFDKENKEEFAKAIDKTNDNGFIILGQIMDSYWNVTLVKVSDKGQELWYKNIGKNNITNLPHDIISLDNGNYIVLFTMDHTLMISEISSDGVLLWENIYQNISVTDAAFDKTSDGGFIIVGHSNITSFIKKIDSQGTQIWEKSWQEKEMAFKSVKETSDTGFVITGIANFNTRFQQPFIIKLDKFGNQ